MKGIPAKRAVLLNAEGIQDEIHRQVTAVHRGAIYHIADELDTAYTTIHSQIFPGPSRAKGLWFDTLRAAHYVTRAKKLEHFLLWPGLTSADIYAGDTKDPETEGVDVILAAGDAVKNFRQALDPDGPGGCGLTFDEQESCQAAILRLKREVAELEAAWCEACEGGKK